MNAVTVPETKADWQILAYPAGVALAHIGLLLLPPEHLSSLSLALVEGGIAIVLVSSLLQDGASTRIVVAFLGLFAGFGGVTIVILRTTIRLWIAALVLGLTVATLTYVVHRYGLVQLNYVESMEGDH